MTNCKIMKIIKATFDVYTRQYPAQLTEYPKIMHILHIIMYCIDLQHKQSLRRVQFWQKKLINRLMIAVKIKKTETSGVLMRKIAAMARLISIMYLSNGNNLPPIHANIYLYPSCSSQFLLNNRVIIHRIEIILLRLYETDSMPSIINGDINLKLLF